MIDHAGGLADEIAAGLVEPADAAIRRWTALEASWPQETLVEVASAVMSRPVWELPDIGPVGMVTGSGGVRVRLPNVSTLASLVASCVPGVVVVKPGSFTSRSRGVGPAGLAGRLGLPTPTSAERLHQMLVRDQFAVVPTEGLYGWLHLPQTFTVAFLCQAIERASFQPCTARWKVNGVVDPTPVIHQLRVGNGHRQRTLVVHGVTDIAGVVIDDVSTAGATRFLLLDDTTRSWRVEPEEFGVRSVSVCELIVPDAMAPERVFQDVLAGIAPGAWVDLVAASAAVTLLHAGAVVNLADGFTTARDVIRSGGALAKLHRLQTRAFDAGSG